MGPAPNLSHYPIKHLAQLQEEPQWRSTFLTKSLHASTLNNRSKHAFKLEPKGKTEYERVQNLTTSSVLLCYPGVRLKIAHNTSFQQKTRWHEA